MKRELELESGSSTGVWKYVLVVFVLVVVLVLLVGDQSVTEIIHCEHGSSKTIPFVNDQLIHNCEEFPGHPTGQAVVLSQI